MTHNSGPIESAVLAAVDAYNAEHREKRERRQKALIQLGARLIVGAIYITLLLVTAAPPWAFVLAAIAATYWGPLR